MARNPRVRCEVVPLGVNGFTVYLTGGVTAEFRLGPGGEVTGTWERVGEIDPPNLRSGGDPRWMSRRQLESVIVGAEHATVIRVVAKILRAVDLRQTDYWQIRMQGNTEAWLAGTGLFSLADLEALSRRPDFMTELLDMRNIQQLSAEYLLWAIARLREAGY